MLVYNFVDDTQLLRYEMVGNTKDQFHTLDILFSYVNKLRIFCFQDIYEATEFHLQASSIVAVPTNDNLYRCVVKFRIQQISALLRSK